MKQELLQEVAQRIAPVCSAANRAFRLLLGEEVAVETADSSAATVEGVLYLLQHPGAGQAEMHEVWLQTMRLDGWVYGPVKDPEKKTHPNVRENKLISADQKRKDVLFAAVVRALTEPLETVMTDAVPN